MFTCTIDHPDIQGNFEITDKFTTITGPSSAGKTYFTELYQKIIEANVSGYVFCDRFVCDLKKRVSPHYAESVVIEHPGCLFLCDEFGAGRLVSEIQALDCYALIVSRRVPSYYSNSYKSVYLAERSDNRTIIQRKFKDLDLPAQFMCNSLLTEDSGAGYRFMKRWICCNTIPCGGRNNIKKFLTDDLAGPYIHVIFDAGGVGSYLDAILEAKGDLESHGYNVSLWAPECFEQLLLGADFINFDGVIPENYGDVYPTTERFCENKIEELTAKTRYEYHHRGGFKTNCWLQDCSDECGMCAEGVTGSKRAVVLQHGPLPNLLRLNQAALVPHYFNFGFEEVVDWCLTHPREIASIPRVQGIISQPSCWQIVKHKNVYVYVHAGTRSMLVSLAITDSGYYMPHGFSYNRLAPLLAPYQDVKPAPFN